MPDRANTPCMSVGTLAIVVASGLFVAAVGYLIRYRGMVGLVAGYDPDEVTDDEGLANLVGGVALAVGAATVLVGVLDYRGVADGVLWYGYGALVVGAAGLMVVGSNRYTR